MYAAQSIVELPTNSQCNRVSQTQQLRLDLGAKLHNKRLQNHSTVVHLPRSITTADFLGEDRADAPAIRLVDGTVDDMLLQPNHSSQSSGSFPHAPDTCIPILFSLNAVATAILHRNDMKPRNHTPGCTRVFVVQASLTANLGVCSQEVRLESEFQVCAYEKQV